MQLTVYPHYVQAHGTSDEFRVLHSILTVSNPKARFSDAEPGSISFVDDEGRFLTGLLYGVHEELVRRRVELSYEITEGVDDPSTRSLVPCPPDILSGVTLRDYQVFAVEHAVHRRRGIVKVATGGGKTAIAAAVAKMVEQEMPGSGSLTFVNKTHLLHQTAKRFEEYGLGRVGKVGAGIFEPGLHTVAMVQTFYKLLVSGRLDGELDHVSLINWDETHHLSARTWSAIGYSVATPYSIGYSGTPFKEAEMSRQSPEDLQIVGMTGRPVVDISATYLIDRGFLARPHIFMIPIPPEASVEAGVDPDVGRSWHKVEKAWITENPYRNEIVTRLSARLVGSGLNPLVLVSKIEHGRELVRLMSEAGLRPLFLSGGPRLHVWEGNEVVSRDIEDSDPYVEEFTAGEWNVLVGSTVFDEGVDLPEIAAVVNAAGGKSFIRNFQRVGRGLRPKPGTNEAYIFDFIDPGHEWTFRHSHKRMDDYKTEPAYRIYTGYKATTDFFGGPW